MPLSRHIGRKSISRRDILMDAPSFLYFGLSCNINFEEEKPMNASIAIQVLPTVDSKEELIPIVDEAIAYIKSFGLHTVVGPFETTVEGDYDTLMEILKGCSQICIQAGAPSVMTYAKINLCPEGVLTIDQKTAKHQEG